MKPFLLNFFALVFIGLPFFTKAQQSAHAKTSNLIVADFKATLENNIVMINWQTISETNCKEFVIEKAGEDGIYFVIGVVKAHGHSYDSFDYSWTDQQPSEGINYYRLKICQNGSDNYSSSVFINFQALKTEPIISPNPSTNGTFEIQLNSNEASTLKIFNRTGRLVYETQSQAGERSINLNSLHLSAGLYYCSIESNGQVFRKPLVISN
jgi:hypothetical protein